MRALLLIVFLMIVAARSLAADDKSAKPNETERIEQLIRQLGAASFEDRERAAKDLIAIGAAALPRLMSVTKDRDREVVRRAKRCLDQIELNEKVAALVAELKNPDPKARAAAADKLTEMRALAKPAVPALIQALDDPDKTVRIRVIVTLGLVGPAGAAAVPRLTRLLNDPNTDVEVRCDAAFFGLANIGKPAESAVPQLLRMLEDRNPYVRGGAARALSVLGRNHKDVVPALLRIMNTEPPDSIALGAVAMALGQIGKNPERCIPVLLGALKKVPTPAPNSNPRVGLMCGLAGFGPAAKAAVPTLVKFVAAENEPTSIHLAAIAALQAIGPDAMDDIRMLQKKVRDPAVLGLIRRAIKIIEADASLGEKRNSDR